MSMNPRQEQLLKIIVEVHIEHAEPVSSTFVVENFDLGVSPATVRNDMVALETAGYIYHPHVSAGRVPTEAGYRYYLANFLQDRPQPSARRKLEEAAALPQDFEMVLHGIAEELVALSGEMAVVSFGPRQSYYLGVSNLFAKPDFNDVAMLQSLSLCLDGFERALAHVANELNDEPRIYLGATNPFGKEISSLLIRYTLPTQQTGVLGIVGPMRMDYGRNRHLLSIAHELLNELL